MTWEGCQNGFNFFQKYTNNRFQLLLFFLIISPIIYILSLKTQISLLPIHTFRFRPFSIPISIIQKSEKLNFEFSKHTCQYLEPQGKPSPQQSSALLPQKMFPVKKKGEEVNFVTFCHIEILICSLRYSALIMALPLSLIDYSAFLLTKYINFQKLCKYINVGSHWTYVLHFIDQPMRVKKNTIKRQFN